MAYVRLLRDRHHFRRLWWGDVVSMLGDWFNMIAVYTAVAALSSSAQALALVFAAKTVPSLLVAPVAGPLVDRFDRRRLLIAMDVLRAAMLVLLIASYEAGLLGGIYAALIVMAMATGIAVPARNAALPMVVPEAELSVANAMEGATWSVMLAVGAALGGVATEVLGVRAALALDGASYVISALIFLGLPRLRPAPSAREDAGFVAGLRYLLDARPVLRVALLKPAMAVAAGGIVLIPVLGRDAPTAVGLLFMARGLGALLGSLLPKKSVVVGFAVYALGFGLLALSGGLAGHALGFLVLSVGAGLLWVESSTRLMSAAEPRFHGRVFAVEHGAMTLVSALAAWLTGAALDGGLSPNEVAALIGVAMLVLGAGWAAAARPEGVPPPAIASR